jgi:hypothetical protein
LVVTEFVAVPLHLPSDLAAQLLVIELVRACAKDALGELSALVLTSGRRWCAVLFFTFGNCLSRSFGTAIFIAARVDTDLEQLTTCMFTAVFAGRRLRLFAVLGDTGF